MKISDLMYKIAGGRRALVSVEVQRDPERIPKAVQGFRIELSAAAAKRALRNREEVVAIDDAVTLEPVLGAQGHLSWEIPNGRCHGGDRHVREERNRSFPGDDDDRSAPSRKLDVVNPAAVQSASPLFAASNAVSPARPASPTHSS